MNRTDLVSATVEALKEKEVKITKAAMTEIQKTIEEVITTTLVNGEDVALQGFGTFTVVERAEREGRNPSTGETMVIPQSKAPKFKASKVMKDVIKATV